MTRRMAMVCGLLWALGVGGPWKASAEESAAPAATECTRATAWVHFEGDARAVSFEGERGQVHDLLHEFRVWLESDRTRQRRSIFPFTGAGNQTISAVVRFDRVVAISHKCSFPSAKPPSKHPITLQMHMDDGNRYSVNVEDVHVRTMLTAYAAWVGGAAQDRYDWGFKRQTGSAYEKHGIVIDFARIILVRKVGGDVPKQPQVAGPCPPKVKGPGY